jgi:polyhydroxyalkanoate synthesis regulator phasin
MATQTECKTVPEVPAEKDADGNIVKPGKPAGQECKPKYDSVADAVRHMIVNQALSLAQQFPSKALQADILALRQQMAAIEAKRKALAEAALAQ